MNEAEEFVYTYCYCEENIWKLCETFSKRKDATFHDLYAVFISNANKTVPVFTKDNNYVVWDYHVVLVRKSLTKSMVYDFDAKSLPFPCSFEEYVKYILRPQIPYKASFIRLYRVCTAKEYMEKFSSDRSHMIKDGVYTAPPPSYPPLMLEGTKNNLMSDFVDMTNTSVGKVLSEKEFLHFFIPDLKLQ